MPGGRTGGEYQTPSLFGKKDRPGKGKGGRIGLLPPQGSRSQPPHTREEEGGDKLIFFRPWTGGVHLVVFLQGLMYASSFLGVLRNRKVNHCAFCNVCRKRASEKIPSAINCRHSLTTCYFPSDFFYFLFRGSQLFPPWAWRQEERKAIGEEEEVSSTNKNTQR